MSARPIFADGVSIVVSADREVFIEFRNQAGAVIAVAGLKVDAAVHVNEMMTDACRRALGVAAPSQVVH